MEVTDGLVSEENNMPHFPQAELDIKYSPTEKEKAPLVPPSQDWICGSRPYEYPLTKTPEDPWEKCHHVVDKNDKKFCKQLKDEISSLLVVTSLFAAIVTGFTNTSLKWLLPNPEDATVDLLREVVQLLSDNGSQRTVPPPQPIVPKNLNYVVVNQLWFLSLILSISAVIVGTLCLQWLAAFRRTDVKHMPHDDALALRQLRFDGLVAWGIPRVPAFLLVAVQTALVLFVTGLVYFLSSINPEAALPVAVVTGVLAFLLALTSVMPLLQSALGWILPQTLVIPQCPYKSPISWAIHRFCVLLVVIFSFPFSWLIRLKCAKADLSEWRKRQLKLLPDFLWQEYDELWRQQRERWGPQSSKAGYKGYSYYLVHSLASAMEALMFGNAVHIIHACLQDFHGTEAEVETFRGLFSEDFPPVEVDLLQDGRVPPTTANRTAVPLSPSKHVHLRRDFLNALALQYFVKHNQKLRRTLLPHRVELYIRIKNSSHRNYQNTRTASSLPYKAAERKTGLIGSSVKCPIQVLSDAQGLSPKLRIHFLACAERLMDNGDTKEGDLSAIGHVLDVCEAEQSLREAQSYSSPLQDEPSSLPTENSSGSPTPPWTKCQPTVDGPTPNDRPKLSTRRQPTVITLVNDLDPDADLIRRVRSKFKERSSPNRLELTRGERNV